MIDIVEDLYLSLSPQYATTHQAIHVNKQIIASNPCYDFQGKGKLNYFKIIQQYPFCYIISGYSTVCSGVGGEGVILQCGY